MNDFEKRWQRIAEQLQLEMSGDERPMVSSGHTLFGIRSDAEVKMERFAHEIETERTEQRRAREAAEREASGSHQDTQRPDDTSAD